VELVAKVTPRVVPVTCSRAHPAGGVVPLPDSKLSLSRGGADCAKLKETKINIDAAKSINVFSVRVTFFIVLIFRLIIIDYRLKIEQ
jgi:hypothetical protein